MCCLSSLRRGVFLFFVLLLCFFSISTLSPVSARGVDNENNTVVMAKSETIDHDYFGAGEQVTISGTVNGDAYVAGGTVIVEGTINGDLLAAGGQVTVLGTVTQNIRVAGGQVVISGQVGRNVTAAAGSLTFTEGATVAGNVVAGAGDLSLLAPVQRDVTLGAGNAVIGNRIGGNITAGVNSLTLTPNASIAGTLRYWSEEQATIDQAAVVTGGVQPQIISPQPRVRADQADDRTAQTAFRIFTFLAILLVGGIIVWMFPHFSLRVARTITGQPLPSLGMGFFALIGLPILCLILLVTVIGIPLAFMLFALYLKLLYISKVFVSLLIGSVILQQFDRKAHILWTYVLGLVVYSMVTWLPFVGGLVSFVALLLGVGSFLLEEHRTMAGLRKKDIV